MVDTKTVENALNVYNMICETEDLINSGVYIHDLDLDLMKQTKEKAEAIIKSVAFGNN